MYLKRLDIQGFKSFPDKIKLEFNKGITVVVGPNGSGKSNISDAVRWVLGEQSAKNLRGSKMEDIIFAGTENRKPLGFAEVSMTLDNEDKTIPIEYSEVTVTRRVYRSGESEYKINNTICRLKDIHELFTDTGIGKEGYSIIGQGRIDEILSTKSEDRRNMFEEAAGILKYKNRREEAQNKLDKEHQNLERAEDIILTLEEQVGPLKLQSEKARKYLELKERLKTIEINLFLIDVEKAETLIDKKQEDIEIVQEQIIKEERNYEALKSEQQILKAEIELFDKDLENLQREFYNINTSIANEESNIKLAQEQINHTLQDVTRIQADTERKKEQLEVSKKSRENYFLKIKSLEMQYENKTKLLKEAQEKFANLNTALSENEELIQNYNNDILDKIQQISKNTSDIQIEENTKKQFIERKGQIEKESKYNVSQINDKNIRLKVLEKSKIEAQDIEKRLLEIVKNAENERIAAEKSLQEEKRTLDLLESNIRKGQSDYNYLQNTQKEHRGFNESVKVLLKAKEAEPQRWNGIKGVIGEIIRVPQEYETAIEIALGASINNIVTEDEQEAKKAIEYLKANKGGRATFLPISTIRARLFGNEKDFALAENGVIGIASELISYDKIYDEIIKSILGRVLIMDNLDNAIIFSRKYKYAYRIVTLEGDVVNVGGSLTGGSKAQNIVNIFARAREIKELEEKITNLKQQLLNQKEKIEEIEENIEEFNELVEDKKKEKEQNHINLISIIQQEEQTKKLIEEIEEKEIDLSIESKQLDEQIKNNFEFLEKLRQALKQAENDKKVIESKLEEFKSNIQIDKKQREELSVQITDMRVEISSLEQDKKSSQDNIERISKEIDDIIKGISANETEIKSLEQDKQSKGISIEDIQKVIIDYKHKKEEKDLKIREMQQLKTEKNNILSQKETETESQSNTISSLKQENVRLQADKNKIEENRKNLYDNIWNEYEITIGTAKNYKFKEIDYSQLQRENRQLKLEIKDLGNVNLDAVEEYKNISERYEFLVAQRDDIIEAEKKLQEIIEELTQLMSKQFKEQFELISANFTEVFSELFGGGTAYLELTDSNNILDSGIEIIAQPPGKVLKNMMLLSGGERGLTAIALLFAILKIKPSPFCILDEIEAALDDANVNRYADYLKKFAQVTQFIVVTHRKGTMAAADILYGVTMQEKGVSKLVSVKFEDAVL